MTAAKSAAKDNGSGAVASMKLQHQTELNTIQFKLKNTELDLGAEQKFREGIEKGCGEVKKTVVKLRGKIDNLMVDAARSRNSMEMMN